MLQTRNWLQAGHRMRLLRHMHGCMHIRKHRQTDNPKTYVMDRSIKMTNVLVALNQYTELAHTCSIRNNKLCKRSLSASRIKVGHKVQLTKRQLTRWTLDRWNRTSAVWRMSPWTCVRWPGARAASERRGACASGLPSPWTFSPSAILPKQISHNQLKYS